MEINSICETKIAVSESFSRVRLSIRDIYGNRTLRWSNRFPMIFGWPENMSGGFSGNVGGKPKDKSVVLILAIHLVALNSVVELLFIYVDGGGMKLTSF